VAEITWCSLSLRDLERQMARLGHRCGKDAIARVMREKGYSLQGMSRAAGVSSAPTGTRRSGILTT
jgi:Rhodopirellula transposase DDE domain